MAVLSPDTLLRAYSIGLFPMAERRDDNTLYWIDPEKRGVLPLDGFKFSKRLRRTIRQGRIEIRCDTCFEDVIRACAEPAPDRDETWINDEIVEIYSELHLMGRAHSVEAWCDGDLVGGLYGVSLGGAYFGESMFSRVPDASKVALVHLVARLKKGDFKLLEIQFVTAHLAKFGAMEIHRGGYRQLLADALDHQATFHRELLPAELEEFLQSTAQTS